MELKDVPLKGGWGDVASIVNDNSRQTAIEISKLKDKDAHDKGRFDTIEELVLAYPTANIGDTAYVNPTYPAFVYKWSGTSWVTTGEMWNGPEMVVDIKQELGGSSGAVMSQAAVTKLMPLMIGQFSLVGFILSSNGELKEDANWAVTELTLLPKTVGITIRGYDGGEQYSQGIVVFYDENGNYLSQYKTEEPIGGIRTVTIPTGLFPLNAVYFRGQTRVYAISESYVLSSNIDMLNAKTFEHSKELNTLNKFVAADNTKAVIFGKIAGEGMRLPKIYDLSTEGDFVELIGYRMVDYTGSSEDINMIKGTSSAAMGLYNKSMYLRPQNGSYSIWNETELNLPVSSWSERNNFKIVKTTLGYELFINDISRGIKEMETSLNYSFFYFFSENASTVSLSELKVHSAHTGDLYYSFLDIYNLSENIGVEAIDYMSKITKNAVDIVENTAKIDKNTIDIAQNAADIARLLPTNLFSRFGKLYDDMGLKSSLVFATPITITENDFVSVDARYWGSDKSTYSDKMGVIHLTSNNSRWGFYNDTQFWIRVTNTYIKWSLPSTINISEWHNYKIVNNGANLELFVDGQTLGTQLNNELIEVVSIATYSVTDSEYTPQRLDLKNLSIKSNQELISIPVLANYNTAENIETIEEETPLELPKYFVFSDTTKEFIFYFENSSTLRLYLNSSRGTKEDEILYVNIWELGQSASGLLVAGESEYVIQCTETDKTLIDFTGGIHGDETIDVEDGDFVKFYIDGQPITLQELALKSGEKIEYDTFYYTQKSSMHKTGYRETNFVTALNAEGLGVLTVGENYNFHIDEIDTGLKAYSSSSIYTTAELPSAGIQSLNVGGKWAISKVNFIYPNHEKIATHLKKTEIFDIGYKTTNSIIFTSQTSVSLIYHGISCISKQFANAGHNENLVDENIVYEGQQTYHLRNYKLREFEGYNADTKKSVLATSTVSSSHFNDSECEMFVVNRPNDAKYYRKTPAFNAAIGDRVDSEMTVIYKG